MRHATSRVRDNGDRAVCDVDATCGADREAAFVATMRHAGRSVIVSGTTVAIGLLSLIVLPLPFIRSIGIGGMLIPAVSVLTAITLLPALLYTLGTKINRLRVLPRRLVEGSDDPEHGFWNRWSRLVVRRPVPVAAVGPRYLREQLGDAVPFGGQNGIAGFGLLERDVDAAGHASPIHKQARRGAAIAPKYCRTIATSGARPRAAGVRRSGLGMTGASGCRSRPAAVGIVPSFRRLIL